MIFLSSRQLMTTKTRGNSSVVEHHLAKVGVAGSNPVFRFSQFLCRGGGTGRRTGLKILRRVTFVPVRFRSSAEFHIKHPWLNWIEYLTTNQAVRGSSPLGCIITFKREVAQLGRALGLGPRGRRFESCLPDKALKRHLLNCKCLFLF